MRKSELQLAFKVQRGKKTYDLPRVTVAEGVISTAEIANAQELNPAILPTLCSLFNKPTCVLSN